MAVCAMRSDEKESGGTPRRRTSAAASAASASAAAAAAAALACMSASIWSSFTFVTLIKSPTTSVRDENP